MSEPRIKEIRRPLKDLEWVSPQTRIQQAVLKLGGQLYRGEFPFALVLDQTGGRKEIVGTITFNEILRSMEPAVHGPEELPIFWLGQFRQDARSLMDRPVVEIMSKVKSAINQTSTLMEALHIMNSNNTDYLLTFQGQSASGIFMWENLYKILIDIAGAR